MDRDTLVRFIEEAFDGVEQPHDITLHVAKAHDGYDYDHDEEHRRKDFFGPWQQIPAEHIKACQEALSYVDKVGMRFYLPAFMVWYLMNFGNKQEVLSDDTLYALDHHPHDPSLSAYHRERFSLFSPAQLRACALFLRFCAEDDSGFTDEEFARKKYERYWAKYEQI